MPVEDCHVTETVVIVNMVKKISAAGNLTTAELNYNLHLSTGTCKAVIVVKVLKKIVNVAVFWSCSAL